MFKKKWTIEKIEEIYKRPLLSLLFSAAKIHNENFQDKELLSCALLSVKTGRCPENCAYCPQSAHYLTNVKSHDLLDKKTVVEFAQKAIAKKCTNFCLSTSGRRVSNEEDFSKLLDMIEELKKYKVKICCTLGSLNDEQALKLKKAGIWGYNHNLDTSPDYYKKIISTHTFEDRLNTLKILTKYGIRICSGGIIGMGESHKDRISLIFSLSSLPRHPDSFPLNVLIPIPGTPLENQKPISSWEWIRMIATIRHVMPKTSIRLAAGRGNFSHSEQMLAFLAGANAIHIGEKLLTAKNCSLKEDDQLLNIALQKLQDLS